MSALGWYELTQTNEALRSEHTECWSVTGVVTRPHSPGLWLVKDILICMWLLPHLSLLPRTVINSFRENFHTYTLLRRLDITEMLLPFQSLVLTQCLIWEGCPSFIRRTGSHDSYPINYPVSFSSAARAGSENQSFRMCTFQDEHSLQLFSLAISLPVTGNTRACNWWPNSAERMG